MPIKILKQQAVNQLISLREDRKAQLQSFFKHLRFDIKMLSDHRLLKDILSEYIAAYNDGGIDGENLRPLIRDTTEDVWGFAKSMDTRICFLSTMRAMF